MAATSPWGSVYTQTYGPQKGHDTVGIASFHFDSETDCYVSYESAPPTIRCQDGSKPPAKMPFKNSSYNPATRTFCADLEWNPVMSGSNVWKYTVVFSTDFASIEGGGVNMGNMDQPFGGLGGLKYAILPGPSEAEKRYLAVFDALASNGALRPKEFAIVMQMEIVQNMKAQLAIAEQMATMMVPIPGLVEEVKPMLVRAIDKLDTSHLRKFLELLFKVMDSNKNGQIERDEFKTIFDIGASMDPTKIQDLLFSMVDTNENGKISCDEAQTLATCVFEVLSTFIASVADILDTVVRAPEVTTIAVKQYKQMTGDEGAAIATREQVEAQVVAMAPMYKMALEAQGNTKEMLDMITLLRDSMARFEESVGARFYMAAMEFSQGGVDEPTFIAKVVPIVVDAQTQQLEKYGNDPIKLMASYPSMSEAFAKYPEPMKEAMKELADSGELSPAMMRGMERMREYFPEMVRAMFRLLDLDDSGTISSQEITLLRAVLDAMIHLGQRAVADPNDPAQRLEGTFEENAKGLALAIFDCIDRDGNGQLNVEELVKFGQKYLSFILEVTKAYSHMTIECYFDEICKVLVSHGFKKAGMEDVDKSQVQGMLMMAPMMAAQAPMMLAQMQGQMAP